MTRVFPVEVERDEAGYWIITSSEVPGAATQVRQVAEAEGAAKNVIALALDVEPDTFEVDIRFVP